MHRVAVGSGHARYFSEQTYTNQLRLTNAPSGIRAAFRSSMPIEFRETLTLPPWQGS